jgi:hypothetical protein
MQKKNDEKKRVALILLFRHFNSAVWNMSLGFPAQRSIKSSTL